MAKTSMINRDIKRKKMVQKYAAKRAELKGEARRTQSHRGEPEVLL